MMTMIRIVIVIVTIYSCDLMLTRHRRDDVALAWMDHVMLF